MKKIFKLIILIAVNILWGCNGCNTKEQIQQAEVAKVELDSIMTIAEKDTVSSAIIEKDEKLKAVVKKENERINKAVEESKFKETPCSEIFEGFKTAVNKYCKGEITHAQLMKESAHIYDVKVKMCLNNKYEKEMDALNEQLEQCMEKRGD